MDRALTRSWVPGPRSSVLVLVALALAPLNAAAPGSDTMAFFGIIEKVVFEPNPDTPERVQLWGAFSYANVSPESAISSVARRGYLYFRLPPGNSAMVRTEWRDLASLAGTGQAVGFGRWGYVGAFPNDPADPRSPWMGLVSGGPRMDLRVRPASEPPTNPVPYEPNIGIAKLNATGSHKGVVAALKAALGK